MELQFPSFPVLFTFLLFLFMIFKRARTSKPSDKNTNLPPGPRKLPIIGNLHQLVGSLPHHCLNKLAEKYGPLMHLQLGEVSTIIVSSPEIAKEVMKTHDINFAQRPFLLAANVITYGYKDIVFAPYGGYWRQVRKICTMELLSANRVKSFRSIREEEVSNLVKTIYSCEGSPFNFSEKIFSMTYGLTSRVAFGKKSKDREAFMQTIGEMIKLASGFSICDLYPSVEALQVLSGIGQKMKVIHQESDRILENIINDHKERRLTGDKEAVEDLVDVLLKLQEHGDLEFPLRNDNIKAVIWDVFTAGSETSSTTVEWTMSEMLRNPKVMKEAQAEVRQVYNEKGNVDETSIHELKFLKAVIKETMRLHPPLPLLLPRETIERCEINGYEIPAKTRVVVNAWKIARDPKYWTEAEKFFPERFLDSTVDYKGANFEYIPFGAGRRICPGISFGQPNVELPLAQLLYHFDWKLPNKMKLEDLDMTEAYGAAVRRKKDLILVPIPVNKAII